MNFDQMKVNQNGYLEEKYFKSFKFDCANNIKIYHQLSYGLTPTYQVIIN